MSRFVCIASCLVCISMVVGCGNDAGKVRGKVTLNGKPVTVGSISFTTLDGSKTAGADLKSDGTFEFPNPITVGKHKVNYEFPELAEDKVTPAVRILEHCVVPENFQADVKAGDNNIDIKLMFKRPDAGGKDDV